MDEQSVPAEARDPRVEAALREYLERLDRGDAPDREKFLAQHPEIAGQLQSFLAVEEQLRNLAPGESSAPANAPRERVASSTASFAMHGQETVAPQAAAGQARRAESSETGLSGHFGRYRIVRALGQGAMGTVYLAQDTQLLREVAIKTPHFEADPAGEQLERFYREARAAATLRHPNICPVYDVGQLDGKHYISMAYIEGRSLASFVQPGKLPSERQTLIVVRKLAQALQEAHDHGIVHRDLKPANIMIDKRGEPIIMDFGLARHIHRETDVRLTQSGMIIGTPAYMAPEQVEGVPDKIGPPTDQFSLGVILYELLTGQLPFRGTMMAVMGQILTKAATAPSRLRPKLDPRIDAACLRMMAKDPAERFPSLSAVADELASILKSPALKSSPKSEDASPTPATGTRPPEKTPEAALASIAKRSLNSKDLASLEELARKCLARHDYDQVIQIVEQIPEARRNAALQALLNKSQEKADEIAFLICEIDEAVRLDDQRAALKYAGELLKIKPGHHRALQVQEDFSRRGKGGAARIDVLRQFTQPWNEGGWIPWSVLAFGLAVFGVMYAVIVIWFGKTAIVIDVKDPKITVEVKGTTIDVIGPDRKTVTVEPGEQQLTIRYDGLEFVTEKTFELQAHHQKIVTISRVHGQIEARVEGEQTPLELTRKQSPPQAKPTDSQLAAIGPAKHPEKSKKEATSGKQTQASHPPLLSAPFDSAAAKNARQQWVDHLQKPAEITNAIGMKLALIPPGEFHMGSADPRLPNDVRPLHRVRITNPFYLGVYEVTQGEYLKLMSSNPSVHHDDPRLPVESLTWNDAQAFLHKLNELPEELRAGRVYRLPTEAEWEYACRAGTETLFSVGDTITINQANFDAGQPKENWLDLPKGTALRETTRVGSYAANAFGLYDMHGNVYEGVSDWYAPDYYAASPVDDPQGPGAGQLGIARGGSWDFRAAPSAYRVAGPRTSGSREVGFRVVCSIVPGENLPEPTSTSTTELAAKREGFTPLFNGKDLAGWTFAPRFRGNWHVENGALIGSKGTYSNLYTQRDDYTDFKLHLEARINAGGTGGLWIRALPPRDENIGTPRAGYKIEIKEPPDTSTPRTGSLLVSNGPRPRDVLSQFLEPLAPPGQWFAIDVTARGDHIVVQVNGKTTADCIDAKRNYNKGSIGLQDYNDKTVVEYRKIEIQELETSATPARPADPRQGIALLGKWHVAGDELVQSEATGMRDPANHRAPLLIFGDENWSDYDLTLEAKVTEGDLGLAVMFHWQDDDDWCDFGLGAYRNAGMELIHMSQGKWGREKGNYKAFRVTKNHWYPIKIKVRGGNVECLLDGERKFRQNDRRFTRGRIGLATWGSAASFRRIRIADPSGKVLWKGPPRLDAPTTAEFLPLFNGRDLTGWKTHPSQPGEWRVANGILVGSGPEKSHLYTDRGDFKNFHLRVEARINDRGNSGVYFRSTFGPGFPANRPTWPYGYEAQIDSTVDVHRTGSLYAGSVGAVSSVSGAPPAGQWFVEEVIANGYRIIIKVNGATTVDYVDDKQISASGHLALQVNSPDTIAEFRKIEIRELEPETKTSEVPQRDAAGPLTAPFDEPAAKAAQQEWAGRLKTKVEVTNSLGMRLRLIPAGQFQMGDDRTDQDKRPLHTVQIARPFYLGTCEVTKGEFTKFVAATAYKTDAERDKGGRRLNNGPKPLVWEPNQQFTWRHPGFPQEQNHPLINVSWQDARVFCDWLSRKERKTYRLPTEAEWEYAARAGTADRPYASGNFEDLKEFANVADATARSKFSDWKTVRFSDGWVYTSPVGHFRPNNFGLYDTIGNALEWCSDWYDRDYYQGSPPADPRGPATGKFRVLRGGSFVATHSATNRSKRKDSHHAPDTGFRVVCEIPADQPADHTSAADSSPAAKGPQRARK